ncbi:hypothetical protein [Micromonospora sp. C81]|uniref:hypothetical protein n=1 Tax=Micromonospora sp. C81 TaxID=2824881 RepID=UPI001B38768E|nr:hypothetical protein [Micromonospora sp. C81]MBQ1038820.1 hypothetical protein [Micromonospora sp. C81]
MDPRQPQENDLWGRLQKEFGPQLLRKFSTLEEAFKTLHGPAGEHKLLRMLHGLNLTVADDLNAAEEICKRLNDMTRPEQPDLPSFSKTSEEALKGSSVQVTGLDRVRCELLSLDLDRLQKLRSELPTTPLSQEAMLQSLELIEARTQELAGQPGSRMLRGSAALGVEIQDLESLAVQLTPAKEMSKLLPGKIRKVPRLCCGDGDWWQFTSDSRNLEFVLRQTGHRSELATMFDDILPLYNGLLTAPPGQYHVGDRIVVLRDPASVRRVKKATEDSASSARKPADSAPAVPESGDTVASTLKPLVSGSAQLQFNIEMPLDLICAFVTGEDMDPGEGQFDGPSGKGAYRVIKPCSDWFKRYFGVTYNFWNLEKTMQEMQMCRQAVEKIGRLTEPAFKDIIRFDFIRDGEAERLVKGYLSLLAMCGIHIGQFRTEHPVKDMPLLCKTNLGALAPQLANAGIIWNSSRSHKAIVGLVRGALPAAPEKFNLKEGLSAITKCLETKEHPLTGVSYAGPFELDVPSTRWTGNCTRFQVVLELRRMPVLPSTLWWPATEAAFDYFVVDKERRFV